VTLFNAADGDSYDVLEEVHVVISNTGNVIFVPPGTFKSTCSIELDDYPFDEQRCELKFGSWTYDASQVNLSNASSEVDLSVYKKSGEWAIQGILKLILNIISALLLCI
jgi:nicotinic acetylcholine receptor